MRRLTGVTGGMAGLLVAGLAMAGSAQAQDWRGYDGPPPYARGWQEGEGLRMIDLVCSGRRAHMLEARLGHEVEEGDIDPDTAGRMHDAIDGLEGRQRRECAEGDVRSVREIGWRYDRIGQWMEAAAHGHEGWRDWRPGWGAR
ncbi:MAG TPA: histidine kinase [Novosphingobium sp.]|nr:histidine kinase [Novosphingobium sp.]